MDKQEVLKEYKNTEDRMLLSLVLDKIKFAETRNKIEYTDFLNIQQISLIETFLLKIKYTNYIFWGGYNNAERKVLIIFHEKIDENILQKNYDKIMSIIRIKLPKNDYGKYTHRNYLGGIIKLGIERDKIGDILVENEGADIIIINDLPKALFQEIPMLKRFEKSVVTVEKIENLKYSEPKSEEVKIIVSSMRLDNFVSDLARTSRAKAVEVIKNERVFINGKLEIKNSKQVKKEDTITIRGKGRFVIKNIEGTTRSGRNIVSVEKFI